MGTVSFLMRRERRKVCSWLGDVAYVTFMHGLSSRWNPIKLLTGRFHSMGDWGGGGQHPN